MKAKSKLFLLPIGATVIAGGAACTAISCAPKEETKFEVKWLATDAKQTTVSNVNAILGKEFKTQISIKDTSELKIDIILNYNTPEKQEWLSEGVDFAWEPTPDVSGSYDLTIWAHAVKTTDITLLLTIDTELVVDTECQESDFDDEIMLTNPLARQESDFETDIVVTTPWRILNLTPALYVNGRKIDPVTDGTTNWEWTKDTETKSHLKVYSHVITTATKSMKVGAILEDKANQLTISGGSPSLSGYTDFKGSDNKNWIPTFREKQIKSTDVEWSIKKKTNDGDIEISIDKNGLVSWDATQVHGQLSVQFDVEAKYTLPGTTHIFTAAPQTVELNLNTTSFEFTTKDKTELEGTEGINKSDVLTTTTKINESDPSTWGLNVEYSLKETGSTTADDLKHFEFNNQKLSWKSSIVEKTYTFKIVAKCENKPASQTYKAEISVTVAIKPAKITISGGTTKLDGGKEGSSGKDNNPWQIKFNDKSVDDTIGWSITSCTPLPKPDGLDIDDDDGCVYWDETIPNTTTKFKVKGAWYSSITGKDYSIESDEITLTFTAREFTVSGNQYLTGIEGQDGTGGNFTARLDGEDVTSEATWSIAWFGHEEETPSWISIDKGVISWDGCVTFEDQSKYIFVVKATLEKPWKTYVWDSSSAEGCGPITFNLTKATLTCEGGSTEIVDTYEGQEYRDNKQWICKLNGEDQVQPSEYIIESEYPLYTSFVRISEDGHLYWDVNTSFGTGSSQDITIKAKYHDDRLQKDIVSDSTNIHIDIQYYEKLIKLNDKVEDIIFNTIEGDGGESDGCFKLFVGGQETTVNSWEVKEVEPKSMEGKITIENQKGENFGKLSWSNNIPVLQQHDQHIAFRIYAYYNLPWMEGEQNVQSKIVQLYINPLIFNLEASSEQYTFNANEGFAGNTKDKLIFNTTFGVEGQQVDVTDKTTFTIVDGGDTPAEVLSKIHFNKETGAIEWDDSIKHGTYKIKLQAEIEKEGLEHEFKKTSETITLNLRENHIGFKYAEGGNKDSCNEFTAHDWKNNFQICWTGEDAPTTTFESNITFSGTTPAGIQFKREGDDTVRPYIGTNVHSDKYEFTMKASYTLPSIGTTYEAEIDMELEVFKKNITISGGSEALTGNEWDGGEDDTPWVVKFKKVGDEDVVVTDDCTFELVKKSDNIPNGAIYYDNGDHKTKWKNTMQAGEYKFAFKVKYTYSGQDYELETHVVTLTLNKIDFTMSEGVNKIETTEWTEGSASKAFKVVLGGAVQQDVTDNATWSIVADESIKNKLSVNKGLVSWNGEVSSDLNNKQFQVKAEYEKTSTNTKYSATSPMITISVNNATFSITGGQVDMIGKEEEPGQASSAWTGKLNPGAIVEGDELSYEIVDCTPLPEGAEITVSEDGLVKWNEKMKLTQQGHPITFKVKATLKKQGRTNPYTYTTDTLSLTINKSSRQLFDEMEWSELISTLHGGGGLATLKQKLTMTEDQSTVGFTKKVTLTMGADDVVEHTVRVVAENHDEKSDETGAAALTFEFVNVITHADGSAETYWMFPQPVSEENGFMDTWATSSLRSYLKNVFMTYLPETISNGIVSVKKEYAEYEGGEYAGNVDDKIWIMSATEAGVAGSSEGAFMKEGTVYDYYSSGDAGLRIKSTIDGNPINIWTRSAELGEWRTKRNWFGIGTSGDIFDLYAISEEKLIVLAFAPCFCI